MNCPKCEFIELKQVQVGKNKLELERCPQCKGIWFELGELNRIPGFKGHTHSVVPKHALQNAAKCPKCKIGLFEFCYPDTVTLVDQCKSCSGLWLDNDEWKAIHKVYDIENQIDCPKCGMTQTKDSACHYCGVVYSKIEKSAQVQPETSVQVKTSKPSIKLKDSYKERSYAENIPGVKGQLLRFIDRSINYLTHY